MGEPQKFALIKLDKVRGNRVYQEEKLFPHLKEDKAKIIENTKLEILLKMQKLKGIVIDVSLM